jgi:cysteine desulfurase/selenocysteine lyase
MRAPGQPFAWRAPSKRDASEGSAHAARYWGALIRRLGSGSSSLEVAALSPAQGSVTRPDTKGMIYLDNAATSWPKPPGVMQAMQQTLAEAGGNPSRGAHRLAMAAEAKQDEVRQKLTRLIDGNDLYRMILCLNCTDALNLGIKGTLRAGDHVISSRLEHNSVSRPLQAMADAGFIELTRVPMAEGGFIDPQTIADAFRPNTKLVAITHCSNVLGTIQPVEEIGRIVRERERLLLVDAAQSIGIVPISVKRMHIDLLAFPGHKELLGPPGTGALYVGERAEVRPLREGGTGGDSATPTQPELWPYCLEAGTPNTLGVAGLGAGIDFVNEHGMENLLRESRALIQRAYDQLVDDDRFELQGTLDVSRKVGILSLTARNMDPLEVSSSLDYAFDVATRPGLHCAPYIHRELGTFPTGSVRLSVGPFNTPEDIDTAIANLKELISWTHKPAAAANRGS